MEDKSIGDAGKTIDPVQKTQKINQDQLYDMLLSRELSWQEIIYDLISSEQLDPWDVDLARLASRYIEKIHELEEANFFISSKVLLAASILLRIKSELLLSHYLKSLDDILFGKTEESAKKFERIELDEEVPDLLPKTPLPRLKKVTLNELVRALDSAIQTEQRRIKREISFTRATRHIGIVLPRVRINIREKIVELYRKIKEFFGREPNKQLTFTYLSGGIDAGREEKIATFVPLLHLNNQSKILLEQEQPFHEILIWLKKHKQELQKLEESQEETQNL